jgi:hypothetical protein
MHNRLHADITDPLGWVVEVDGQCKKEGAIKEGWTKMRLLDLIELPTVAETQRVAYAILCALEVETSEAWRIWARRWLSGEDRSPKSAEAAKAWVTMDSAALAADAAWAAYVEAGRVVETQTALSVLSAAEFVWSAFNGKKPLDLIALSEQAMQYK